MSSPRSPTDSTSRERSGREAGSRADDRKRALWVLVLLLLFVVLFGVVWLIYRGRAGTVGPGESWERGITVVSDTGDSAVSTVDTVSVVAADSLDTALSHPETSGSTGRGSGPSLSGGGHAGDDEHQRGDTVRGLGDTLTVDSAAGADSLSATAAANDPCVQDTVAPWVCPDPSGGLHRRTVKLQFVADEPCTIEWRLRQDKIWLAYDGSWITIDKSATLVYRAVDSCGNSMAQKTENYVVDRGPKSSRCPGGMELVEIGKTAFCIDHYEWPNEHNTRPASFVSLYQAKDSCFSVDKRLCTSDEWKLACSGPYGWKYPYGDRFERRACVTKDTAVARSGLRPECRGYFEVFDMSGNLLEWTSTRSKENNTFYNVMGGFWESDQQSGCFDTRYSYFPQNRHNVVGFRCCRDAAPGEQGRP